MIIRMEKKIFLVAKNEEGYRLDHFLTLQDNTRTRSFWQKLCRLGYVSLDGETEKKTGVKLKAGQKIETFIPPPESMEALAEDIPLDIVFEDKDIIVINKPKGMVVHPAAGHRNGTLVNALLAHCLDLSAIGDRIRPGILHRLDKDTTGLLMVAKNETAFRSLSAQFKNRQVRKEYRAIVHGSPKAKDGTITTYLGRDYLDRKKFAVMADGKGRNAITHFQVLEKRSHFSHLSLQLETGRTHQIRVHLAYIGCPIAGDPLYGPKRSPYRDLGQLLHARTLGFTHPGSGEYLEFVAEPDKDFFSFFNNTD